MLIDRTEWRCERLLELDHLIEAEQRKEKPGHRRGAGPGWREARRRRLEVYAAKMRAGYTSGTQHVRFKFTDEQRQLIAAGVPQSFFEPPRQES